MGRKEMETAQPRDSRAREAVHAAPASIDAIEAEVDEEEESSLVLRVLYSACCMQRAGAGNSAQVYTRAGWCS